MRLILLVRIYVILAILLFLGGVAGFVRLWPSLGRPFGGFIWQYDNVRGSSVSYDVPRHWPGPESGLVPHTTILTINNRPALDFAAVYATAPIGTPMTYEVITPDRQHRTITVPVVRFDLGYLSDGYSLIFLMGMSLASGGYILLRSARSTGRALLAFILLVASVPSFYHTHNGNVTFFYNARFFSSIMWAPSPALLGALLCHAALIYPRPHRLVKRWPWIVPLCYLTALVLGPLLGVTLFFGADPRVAPFQTPALYASMGYVLLGVAATLINGLWTIVRRHDILAQAERRQIRIIAVAWLIGVVVLIGTLGAANLRFPTPFETLIVVAILLPIGLVYAITNADLIAQLEEENILRGQLLEDVREVHRLQERILSELADELHDSALAESKALEVRLYTLLYQVTTNQVDQKQLSDELTHLHQQSLVLGRTLRQTVEGAKPVDFTHEGLITAVERVVTQLNVASDSTTYTLEHQGGVDECSIDVKGEVYWIIRAALNNVRDHAHARHCTIQLTKQDSALEILIRDDGRGAAIDERRPAPVPLRRRMGLPSMRARAERLGGYMQVMSVGRGTQVQVIIPLKEVSTNERYIDTHPHR